MMRNGSSTVPLPARHFALGRNVSGVAIGDHVVVDGMRFEDGLLGSGGAQGALTPLVVVRDFIPGRQLRVIPNDIPWTVAALNEPMAVAHHAVNRSGATAGDSAVVFGAGPIGLGALLSLRSRGVAHVVVVDVIASRLDKALSIGADAVINSGNQEDGDVVAALVELQGGVPDAFGRGTRAGTDVYIDAAGVASVPRTVFAAAKTRCVLAIPAVHKAPVPVDLGQILQTEIDIRMSMGYPDEIFEVTDAILADPDRYAAIISDTVPFDRALDALTLARTPGAADKVVVTFDRSGPH